VQIVVLAYVVTWNVEKKNILINIVLVAVVILVFYVEIIVIFQVVIFAT
jgi:hypothetical protein